MKLRFLLPLLFGAVIASAQVPFQTSRAIITTNGIVGSPSGSVPVTEFEVDTSLTTSPRGILSGQFNTGTDGARFHGRKARGTRASPLVIVSGDNLTRWVGSGYDGSNYLEMASITFGTEGTIALTQVPTFMSFSVATNAAPSVLTERGRFTSGGNLLIGGTTDITGSGGLKVFGTTASTSTTTGSLINAGGFGNAGAAYIGGVCQIGTATNFATANAGVIQSFRTSADGQLRLTRSGAHDWDIFGGATTLYMTVDGGSSIFSLGTTGNATLAGNLTASSTTEATTTAAAIATEGGILAKKKLALSTYADGTLSVATGIVVSSSDARLKNITGSFTRGLADVVKIHPAKYTWRPESGVISAKEYSGFVAQDVQAAIPEAVSADAMGMRGLSDRTILAAVVNGMKELADRPSAVEIRIFELIALAALILGIRANISSIRK